MCSKQNRKYMFFLTKDTLCKCKCKFDDRKCNSNQWNNDKC